MIDDHMKNKFREYYKLSDDQLKELFEDCLFVLDTNVLLDCVRMRPDLAEKVLTILENHGDRVKLPSHATLEYHKHASEEVAKNLQKLRNYRKSLDENMQFQCFVPQEYSLYLDSGQLSGIEQNFNDFRVKLLTQIKVQIDHWNNEFQNQKMQNRIASIFSHSVLADVTQIDYDNRKNEASKRIENKIPPGYKDGSKTENCEGDYFIWCEILDLASREHRSVIFISEDLKEDWLQKVGGLTIGPLPYLRKEFYTRCPDHEIHFYCLSQFLRYADPLHKVITEKEVEEIEHRRALLKNEDQKAKKNQEIKNRQKNISSEKGK